MVKIYIEGGGDSSNLHRQCRKAFSSFFEKSGFKDRMPRTVACGSRSEAYDDFCTAVRNSPKTGEIAFLLVDSEDPIKLDHANEPWLHLYERDGWEKPDNANEEQVHLMVQCMESWFLADSSALRAVFGQGFNANALPRNPNIEAIDKSQVLNAMKNSTRHCNQQYSKGGNSFKILEHVDPNKVRAVSPWAQRLVAVLEKHL